jgi:LysR family tcuABC transcriptional regulator
MRASSLETFRVREKYRIAGWGISVAYTRGLPEVLVDLRQLRYFAQIVESGSLSKASRLLYVAQPALSQQVARLEDEVGRALLVRSPTGVTPTEHGLALYHHARFVLRQVDQAMSIARQGSGAVEGMVSVGLPATTVAALGLALVRRVHQRYPGILLNVVEGMSGHLAEMMRLGKLDLAVLFSSDVTRDASVESLVEEELFVFLARGDALFPAQRTSITFAEVASLPLIVPTAEHGLRRCIAAEFEARNLAMRIVAEIDSLSLVMSCVHSGLAATIKPMSAALLEGERGRRLRALTISDVRLTRRNYLYSLPPNRLSPAAAAVATELRGTVRDAVDASTWAGAIVASDGPQPGGVVPVPLRPRAVAAAARPKARTVHAVK